MARPASGTGAGPGEPMRQLLTSLASGVTCLTRARWLSFSGPPYCCWMVGQAQVSARAGQGVVDIRQPSTYIFGIYQIYTRYAPGIYRRKSIDTRYIPGIRGIWHIIKDDGFIKINAQTINVGPGHSYSEDFTIGDKIVFNVYLNIHIVGIQ